MPTKNVVSQPTTPDGVQGWKCQVCGRSFSYSQPISFSLQLGMLKLFMDAHEHDTPPVEDPTLAFYETEASDLLLEVIGDAPDHEHTGLITNLMATLLKHRDDDVKMLTEALKHKSTHVTGA
jgi:hypothetical protein